MGAFVLMAIGFGFGAPPAFAQQPVATNRQPAGGPRDAEVLARPVTLTLDRVTLRQAITALAKYTNVLIEYRAEALEAAEHTVSIRATREPLGAVLERVLSGSRLRIIVTAPDAIALKPVDTDAVADGGINGTVIDGRTKQPLRGATVVLDDSVRRTLTDAQGHFQFTGIAAGSHRVTVRFVGYARQVRVVVVTDDHMIPIDVVLQSSINTLDQVVVTATGDQRVRELGHVVARINTDSLVKSAPISSVADLLQSRVPGLQVLTGDGGTAGGEVSLRLRGQTTINLSAEPIVIVDGVRFKSTNAVQRSFTYSTLQEDVRGAGETRSPLFDLNPNDIETVEVVKGPSASTLYGPDAANGVIVITTKRGQAGKTEFKWYARPVSSAVPTDKVSTVYQAYGHNPTTGALFGGNCSLVYQYHYHICVLDSIAPAPTRVADPAYSVLAKSSPTWQYGANVSGGSPVIRYFLSGNYDSQVGALQVSPKIAEYLENLLGTPSLGHDIRKPNTMRDLGGHASLSVDASANTSVSGVLGYTQTTRVSSATSLNIFTGFGPGADTTHVENLFDPYQFLRLSTEQSSRFTGSLNGVYRPRAWLSATVLVGLDLAPSLVHTILPREGAIPDYYSMAEDSRRSNVERTLSLGATAIAHPGTLSFRSSLGVQYHYTHLDGVDVTGSSLAPGSSSIQTASQLSTVQLWNEMASLGTYGEEVVGFRDRLFLTGSLRIDGSSTFGDQYRPTPYPKVGLSWIASDEPWLRNVPGVRELRLRYSFGAASRYPTSGMKLGVQNGRATLVEGSSQTIFDRSSFGNPDLRPERTREAEYGADATVLSGVQIGLTWYRRRTTDQLLVIQNAVGLVPQYSNLGLVSAHGFEATATTSLINTPTVRADLGFTYAFHTDKVLSLGSAPDSRGNYGGYAVGYPLAAEFGQPILGVADTVGGGPDSIVFSNEVIMDSVNRFLGVTTPPKTYTLTPMLALWGSRVQLSATFDRETGFIELGGNASNYGGGLCLAAYERSASVMAQAQCFLNPAITPGDFTRWRELTMTLDIPPRFLRFDPIHLQFSHASLSLQGRNLRLWTRFDGSDPESRAAPTSTNPVAGGIPQARSWSFRFDLTP